MGEPDAVPVCPNCHGPCSTKASSLAHQIQSVSYASRSETPEDGAHLTLHDGRVLALFCSHACCKQVLPGLLSAVGLPVPAAPIQTAGPVAPCLGCGKPVVMAEPHEAIAEHHHKTELPQPGEVPVPDVFTVLGVLCRGCGWLEEEATAIDSVSCERDQETPLPAAMR